MYSVNYETFKGKGAHKGHFMLSELISSISPHLLHMGCLTVILDQMYLDRPDIGQHNIVQTDLNEPYEPI